MVTYAFSLIPEQRRDASGKTIPVDKSDVNTFVIPNNDARQVIRAATRSAYAEVCGMPELAEANLKALIAQESKKGWTSRQMLMVEALHLFALSYFTGNAQIIEETDESGGAPVMQAPPAPKCPPEQKAKVENAIRAYVASVGAN